MILAHSPHGAGAALLGALNLTLAPVACAAQPAAMVICTAKGPVRAPPTGDRHDNPTLACHGALTGRKREAIARAADEPDGV